jgi:hypothetical protein
VFSDRLVVFGFLIEEQTRFVGEFYADLIRGYGINVA